MAITPQNVALLLKNGVKQVLVQDGAGLEAQFTTDQYKAAGATIVDAQTVWKSSDVVLKVRAPSTGSGGEVDSIKEGSTVISFLYPAQNPQVVDAIAKHKATLFAMDCVPRISRAQVFDALR